MIKHKGLRELLENVIKEGPRVTHEFSVSEPPSYRDIVAANQGLRKNKIFGYHFRCYYCEVCKGYHPNHPYHLELRGNNERDYD